MVLEILIEAVEANPLPFTFFVLLGHQDRAHGSHRGKMFWNDELSIGNF